MPAYQILKVDNLPESLKKKPRLVTCVLLALGMLAITASAVAVGIIIGYTYCYIEHHTGFRTANITRSSKYHIVSVPETEETKGNRTINGALMSSVLFTRILKLGHALVDDELTLVPWNRDERMFPQLT